MYILTKQRKKMSKPVLVTRTSLQRMLDNPDQEKVQHVIGRALVALLRRQTSAEQTNNATLVHNNIGFTGVDGRSGAITAKYYIKNKSLLPWQTRSWLKKGKNGFSRIAKYHAQLNEVAIARAAQQQAE